MEIITNKDILELFENYILNKNLKRSECQTNYRNCATNKCKDLFSKDFDFFVLENKKYGLCSTYGQEIYVVPKKRLVIKSSNKNKNKRNKTNSNKFNNNNNNNNNNKNKNKNKNKSSLIKWNEQLIAKLILSRDSRLRMRYPVEVINLDGKSICRSSTLSKTPEVILNRRNRVGEILTDLRMNSLPQKIKNKDQIKNKKKNEAVTETKTKTQTKTQTQTQTQTNNIILEMNKKRKMLKRKSLKSSYNDGLVPLLRLADISLLKKIWKVKYIVDLMVENKKRIFGFEISGSEKADSYNRYCGFSINSLPYPGVELFEEFAVNNYNAKGIIYNWSDPINTTTLKMDPELQSLIPIRKVCWKNYRSWDIIKLTQNYFKLMLSMVSDPTKNSGLDIHCLSGWDRTPLFISLIRISLWADGLIHKSLSAQEMLYLTISYDWLLFGHKLNERLQKNYQILCFQFYFLKYISFDDYSYNTFRNAWKYKFLKDNTFLFQNNNKNRKKFPNISSTRITKLTQLRKEFKKCYSKKLIKTIIK
ncbi:myotubularin-related protein [Anaeramoeba flamelloides]|uniref:Myotubularin-related protein n=1 Tax=Anaeramoeba flamelloides TaxID=1746091 RepID=A0ABQ8X324_9EUKA|nr:myotubularin-related protein [Anaeramoeba flamelloides]